MDQHESFKRKKVVKHTESEERFPPNVTGALELTEDKMFFFRQDKYCLRPKDGKKDPKLKEPQFVSVTPSS